MGKEKASFKLKCSTDYEGNGVCEVKVKDYGKTAECLIKVAEDCTVEVSCTGDKEILDKLPKHFLTVK